MKKLIFLMLAGIVFLLMPFILDLRPLPNPLLRGEGIAVAEDIITTDKLITVDTGKQQLTAWDNGAIFFQTSVSTGLYQTPTVKGNFRIYAKLPVQDMKGYSEVHGNYFLKNVPYIMYFYQGYGIHGTYWHNNFGTPMSNGCVNMSIADAEKIYNWADVGTKVLVY